MHNMSFVRSAMVFGMVLVVAAGISHRAESAPGVAVEPFKGYRQVTSAAPTSQLISVPRAGLKTPLVLGMGSTGRPIRRVIPFMKGKAVLFRARPSTSYQVWELRDYVSSVARRASALLGNLPGTTARARLRAAWSKLRNASTDEQTIMRLDVARALAASDCLVTSVTADAPTDNPSEYRISVIRPLTITATLANGSSRTIKARIARTVSPTDWTSTAKTPSSWVVVRPHQRRFWTFQLTAPKRAYPGASYPVIVWFDLRSDGLEWRTEDSCTLLVNSAKQRK